MKDKGTEKHDRESERVGGKREESERKARGWEDQKTRTEDRAGVLDDGGLHAQTDS